MHSKVSSDWLQSYMKTTQPVLEIFKMAGYFPDRPRIAISNEPPKAGSETLLDFPVMCLPAVAVLCHISVTL